MFEMKGQIDPNDPALKPEALAAANHVLATFPFVAKASGSSPLSGDVHTWVQSQGFPVPEDQYDDFVRYVAFGKGWEWEERTPKRLNIYGPAWALEQARITRSPFRVRGTELRWLDRRDITPRDIEKVILDHPALTHSGYGRPRMSRDVLPLRNTPNTVHSVHAQVQPVAQWIIENVPVQRGVPRDADTSYGWKHVVERSRGGYVSNTTFIVAALALGIPMRLDDLNPEIGLPAWVADILDARARARKVGV